MKKSKILNFLLVISFICIFKLLSFSQCALSQLMQANGYSFTYVGEKSFQSVNGTPIPVYGKVGDINFTSPLTSSSLLVNSEDFERLEVNVFPNPCIDFVWVKIGEKENVQLKVTDLTGRIIFNYKVENKPLDVSMLQPGVYYFSLNSGVLLKTLRIIKI